MPNIAVMANAGNDGPRCSFGDIHERQDCAVLIIANAGFRRLSAFYAFRSICH
jgi:hypothetical protein